MHRTAYKGFWIILFCLSIGMSTSLFATVSILTWVIGDNLIWILYVLYICVKYEVVLYIDCVLGVYIFFWEHAFESKCVIPNEKIWDWNLNRDLYTWYLLTYINKVEVLLKMKAALYYVVWHITPWKQFFLFKPIKWAFKIFTIFSLGVFHHNCALCLLNPLFQFFFET